MTTSPRSRQSAPPRRGGGPPIRRRRDSLVGEDGTIDYKDAQLMRRFVNEQGKMTPGRRLRMSSKMQRRAAIAVKRARHLALIPMAPKHSYVTGAIQLESRGAETEEGIEEVQNGSQEAEVGAIEATSQVVDEPEDPSNDESGEVEASTSDGEGDSDADADPEQSAAS